MVREYSEKRVRGLKDDAEVGVGNGAGA